MLVFNDENINKFISDLTDKCKHYGVELYISKSKRVNCGGTYSSGYFDGTNKKIAIAGKLKTNDFISILVHEASHFDQWILNNKVWKDYSNLNHNYSFNDVIKGLTPVDAVHYCKTFAKLEWDCERKAVNTIKKYNLPIDIKDYCKKANAYIYFWLLLPELKNWYADSKTGKAPYGKKNIVNLCPTKIPKSFNDIIINEKLVNEFKKNYQL